MTTLWDLSWRFLQIGFFSIGGGYATIPLIQQYVVDGPGWLSLREFADIITISQMTPGPLAVNTSTFVGMRVAGLPGAVVATFGCIASGFVVSLCLYRFFARRSDNVIAQKVLFALKASSVGLIAAAASSLLVLALGGANGATREAVTWSGVTAALPLFGFFGVSLLLLRKYRLHPLLVLGLSGLGGIILYY